MTLTEGGDVRQLSPIEREKAKLLKLARTLIRAKHSAAADDELNEKLPLLELQIDKAIQSGKVYELDVRSVLESD